MVREGTRGRARATNAARDGGTLGGAYNAIAADSTLSTNMAVGVMARLRVDARARRERMRRGIR